ncbi:outer membrane beta-barrel protein [Flavobacterium franklandianum]|uniref:Outer membrane beta-barrel protein n=1 Tax=Flavobacterium franklandianum TaxID=2594430 RepID=A0A553CJI6_9FLAO|nr:outer membrane beta-barrel protein [Flavobacterium franklandianum]TRX20662.1 outer membrane beta-barrel protein [Flavobacterium franklandianum]
MPKIYSFLLMLLFFFSANAQNEIIIKGTVYDINTQIPLELATVYFSSAKDSAVIEYVNTDKNGVFKMSIKKYDKPVFLKVNYMGYQPYIEEQNTLLESKDYGKVYLLQNTKELNEVVIKSEAPPVRVKKDTLEFNASSFKVRPDANVEILLKQLPGFEVDSDGKITVNGKEVTQFLVNGKAFFDKDGAVALKNLPADLISKVQVSDLKTKKEELSKQESSSDYSSINLTIDEKINKGYFGKFLGGYGTDDRYEASLIVNFFDNKQKISLLASANNINSTGFSQDEVFDSMGGGRNARGDTRATGGRGITESNLVGFNYSDEWLKDLEASASYNFSNSVNKNESKSNQANFLPTGTIFTESDSKSRNENTGNKVNFEFEHKINPTTRIVVTPKVDQTLSNSHSESSSFSKDEKEESLNENNSKSYRESTATNFGNSINFNKAFERKARNLSFVFTNNNSNSDSDVQNLSETIFYQGDKPNDERNQNSKTQNTYDSYSADIEYTEPITDSLRVRIGSDFDWSNAINDLKTFDYDATSQSYSTLNDLQTNYTSSRQNSITPKVGITFEKNNFTFNLNSSTSIIDFDNHSLYLNKITDLNQKYVLPYGRAQIRYKLDRSKFLTLRYDYSNSLPSSTQLMSVGNLANPLNTIIGNPNLNPNEKNSVNINYRNFDMRTRSGYNLYMRGDFFNSEVVSTSVYDESGKRTTTYKNVSGTYTTSLGGNWNQTVKSEAHVLRYGLSLSGNYSLDKGFTNTVLYDAKSLGVTPRVYFSYDYGELLTIAPSYNLSYNESRYTNSSLKASSNVVHRINLQTTNYWPKNWIFGNDFGYAYNSNISDDFKKDFYLWNTSLSYGFFDKKMTLKVKVYDVLNQNLSATRTISPTTIRDEENTVLKRYAMFSLAYKLGNFGGKENRSRGSRNRGMDNED